ncbi:MAG: PAS domain-containing protein [Bacillota bacterium]
MVSLNKQKNSIDQLEEQKIYFDHLEKVCSFITEDLQNDHSHIKALLSVIPSGISIATDKTCKDIIHNPVAAKFLRIGEWESFSLSADVPPPVKLFNKGQELIPELLPMQRSAWYGETIENMEIEFVWADGVEKASLWSSSPLKDAHGVIIGAIAAFKDTTQNKILEKENILHREKLEEMVRERSDELYRVNERLHTVLNSITDAFCTMDKSWIITYLNNAAEVIFRIPKEQAIRRCIWDLFPKFKDTIVYGEFMRAVKKIFLLTLRAKVFTPGSGLSIMFTLPVKVLQSILVISLRRKKLSKRLSLPRNVLARSSNSAP